MLLALGVLLLAFLAWLAFCMALGFAVALFRHARALCGHAYALGAILWMVLAESVLLTARIAALAYGWLRRCSRWLEPRVAKMRGFR